MNETNSVWEKLGGVVEKCGINLRKSIKLQRLANKGDAKIFIYPVAMNDSLVSVTLGIGGDVKVEKQLNATFTNIDFFGADPFEATAGVFRALGNVYLTGIGPIDGQINSSILTNDDPQKPIYNTKTIASITFKNYLNKIKQNFIDFLLIDIEGPEYWVLPKIFDEEMRNEYTICQLNIEIHGPLESYGVTTKQFDALIFSSLDSSFLPLSLPAGGTHRN
ncbi:unnamed protein product, partial [Mesorhabditis belari]